MGNYLFLKKIHLGDNMEPQMSIDERQQHYLCAVFGVECETSIEMNMMG